MLNLTDLLSSPIGQQIVSGISQQTNQPADKTGNLLNMALPVLMGAMKKNATTQEGAENLMGALNHHQGGILDNLGTLFQGGVDQSVQKDGDNILGHLLGNKRPQVETALSKESGIDMNTVVNVLKIAAPIVMGMVGKQKQQASVSDAGGLGSMLGGLLGSTPQTTGSNSIITSILDADGDGSILDDVAGMALGKNKGGLGGLMGGLFGK